MNNELKRVGLVFKEDGAADFRKSLQLVNAELSKNYSEFKKTQAQWDNSTKKTEKLKLEIDSLSNAYELQQDKITILKSQLSELESAENQNVTAITKKRAELEKAELKLISYDKKIKELSNQLKISGKDITDFGENVNKVGNKIESWGNKISLFSTVTATALSLSAKSAIDFEDAFAGVEKTVDGTEEQMETLKQGIRDLAKEIPSSTTEIAAVAEAAGQLGIQTDNILSFSKAMIDLGNSTNLTSAEAASQLAKFANIMQMSQKEFDKLGSAIVDLGNNFATTEADIVEMAMRLAGAGKQVGLSEGQVLGLATALSSVGIEAEMGGSAISKAMVKMQNAVELGGSKLNDVLNKTGMSLRELELMAANDSMGFKEMSQSIGMTSTEVKQLITAGTNLEDFSKISGMTAEQFKKAWEEDAAGALTSFIQGLGDAESKGESATTMLTEMGLTEVRLRDSLLRAANAGTLFNDAIETGSKAWEENTALTNEANKRYGTLKSQLQTALNKLSDLAITLGNKLMPSIQKIIDKFSDWIKKFDDLSEEQIDLILKIGMLITAIGPLITVIGKITSGVGTAIKGVGTFKTALEVMKGTTTSTSLAVNGLASVFSAVTSPIGIACIAITGAVAGIATAVNSSQKEIKKDFETMGESATDFINGINDATSHLQDFNSELFASSQEQQELQNQMSEIQKAITNICKTASDERRNYTQEEITQLDEYFTKLRELNQRELEIQQQISTAITQQAITNAESFQGSLEEYKIQSQEWLKTAEDQKNKTIELINQQTIEEVALLNQRYGDQATMQNAAYATEYNQIMLQKQSKIDAANDEIAKISEAYTNGYAQRSLQQNGFYTDVQNTNSLIEQENQRHTQRLDEINSAWYATEDMRRGAIEGETAAHNSNMKKIWQDMAKNMSDAEAEELGTWMGMLANTELYGRDISDENQLMVDTIMDSYDAMPSETRTAMKDAMSPMLDEMEKAEPGLFAKAFSIANGIINRLKKAFDEHSPSRKTRQIAKFAMQPMEEEMEKGKKNLFEQADEIGNGITDRLGNMETSYTLNSKNNATSTNNTSNDSIIDYDKLANSFLSALNKCKLAIEEDGFAKIIKDEIYKVV